MAIQSDEKIKTAHSKDLDRNLVYYGGDEERHYCICQFRKYRLDQIIRYFGSSVIEIGSGLGAEIEYLRDHHGRKVVSVEPNQQARDLLAGKGLICLSSLDEVKGLYATAYLSHVLEHISPEKVYDFFREITRNVEPGGTVVIVSPVGKWFWDQPDHFRIYDRPAILALFREQGLQEIFYTYTGSQYVAWNVLSPIRNYLFSHRWSLGLFYRLSSLSRRDLVIVGQKPGAHQN